MQREQFTSQKMAGKANAVNVAILATPRQDMGSQNHFLVASAQQDRTVKEEELSLRFELRFDTIYIGASTAVQLTEDLEMSLVVDIFHLRSPASKVR